MIRLYSMKSQLIFLISVLIMISCNSTDKNENSIKNVFTGEDGEVKLIVLSPGHFHASLLQKEDIDQVNDTVYVYAQDGPEVDQYLKNIDQYNGREVNPTKWNEIVYKGDDFLTKLLNEKKGNVVVLSGKNQDKTEFILSSVNNGLNVLSDKPLAINTDDFRKLEQSFNSADSNKVILYDMMTERYDLLNIIEKGIVNNIDLFGELEKGSPDNPSIVMNSEHHFYKDVSGVPTIRPAWYYDVEQQGEGIVDVTTHLIDLVNWKFFTDPSLNYNNDIEVLKATHWPTEISLDEFSKSTNETSFPSYLNKYLKNDKLQVFANGTINYNIKGVNVEVIVKWDFYGPNHGADTYSSIIKGSKASTIMLQNEEQNYIRQLYIKRNDAVSKADFVDNLNKSINVLKNKYPFISFKETDDNLYLIEIPVENRTNHESHFKNVAEVFFGYLVNRNMPNWEIPNTIAKYYITTKALEIAETK